jgi:hypothetical protein
LAGIWQEAVMAYCEVNPVTVYLEGLSDVTKAPVMIFDLQFEI